MKQELNIVYFFKAFYRMADCLVPFWKIGKTNKPKIRLSELTTWVKYHTEFTQPSDSFEVVFMFESGYDALALENQFHKSLLHLNVGQTICNEGHICFNPAKRLKEWFWMEDGMVDILKHCISVGGGHQLFFEAMEWAKEFAK